MTEIWKDVKGYEGLYKISNHGEVWSERKQGLLKKGKCATGYYSVSLAKNKKQKTFTIHRLVAIHFIDNPLKKPCVNHMDESRTNNHYSNLEWCTYKENNNWGTGNERRKETRKHSSKWKEYVEKNNKETSKPIIGINIDNGEVIEFSSISEAGRNGYTRGNIQMCLNGKRSKHKGYKWFYKKNYIQGVGRC